MNIRRYAVMLIGLFVLMFASVANAEVFYKFYINKNLFLITITVRDEPSIFGNVQLKVRSFCPLVMGGRCQFPYQPLTGKFQNGWFEVAYGKSLEKTGWVLGDFVEIEQGTFQEEQKTSLTKFWETYVPHIPIEFTVTENGVLARNGPHISAGTHVHDWGCKTLSNCRGYETFKRGDRVTVAGYQGNYYKVVAIDGVPHEPIWIYKEFLKNTMFRTFEQHRSNEASPSH